MNTHFYRNWYEVEEDAEKRDEIKENGARKASRELTSGFLSDITNFAIIQRILENTGLDVTDPELEALFSDEVDKRFGVSRKYKEQESKFTETVVAVSAAILLLTMTRIGREYEPDELLDKHVREFAQQSLRYYGIGTHKYVKEVYRRVVQEGQALDIDDLIREVKVKYRVRQYMARTIANTAVGDVVGQTTLHAFMQEPAIGYVQMDNKRRFKGSSISHDKCKCYPPKRNIISKWVYNSSLFMELPVPHYSTASFRSLVLTKMDNIHSRGVSHHLTRHRHLLNTLINQIHYSTSLHIY